MPITNTQQARIDLSAAQVKAFVDEIVPGIENMHIPMVWFEETNLDFTVAVGSKRGTSLIHHSGEVHHIGPGAVSYRPPEAA